MLNKNQARESKNLKSPSNFTNKPTKNTQKAFSLIELVFAIVIIGILVAVALPRLAANRDDARYVVMISNIDDVVSQAVARYTLTKNFDFMAEHSGSKNAPIRLAIGGYASLYANYRNAIDSPAAPGPLVSNTSGIGVSIDPNNSNKRCFVMNTGYYKEKGRDGAIYPAIFLISDHFFPPQDDSELCKRVRAHIEQKYPTVVQSRGITYKGVIILTD